MIGWTSKYGIDPTGSELTTLCQAVSGVITGSGDLVVNGAFDTDTDWIKGSGWTISGGFANCDGTQSSPSLLYSSVDVVWPPIGDVAIITFEITSRTSGGCAINIGGTGTTDTIFFSTVGTYTLSRVITGVEGSIGLLADISFSGSVDNLSIHREDFVDYSPNSFGMYVNGSLTATAVDDGSELPWISGFSVSDHVDQHHNSSFDFDVNDFAISLWFISGGNSGTENLLNYGYYSAGWVGSFILLKLDSSGSVGYQFSDDGTATNDTALTSEIYDDGLPHYVLFGKRNGNWFIDIDGVNVVNNTPVNAIASMSNSSGVTRIGCRIDGAGPATTSSISPITISVNTTVSVEQGNFWYQEQSRLFKKYTPIQIVGETYQMDVDHDRSDPSDNFDSSMIRSYGGNSQTIIMDEYEAYNLRTSILEDLDVGKFAAFLRSAYGEIFTYDELGTIALPYEPLELEMTSANRPRSRVGYLPRSMTFTYKARTV